MKMLVVSLVQSSIVLQHKTTRNMVSTTQSTCLLGRGNYHNSNQNFICANDMKYVSWHWTTSHQVSQHSESFREFQSTSPELYEFTSQDSTPATFIVFSLSPVILDTLCGFTLTPIPHSSISFRAIAPPLQLPPSPSPLPIIPPFPSPPLLLFHRPSPFLHYCAHGRPLPPYSAVSRIIPYAGPLTEPPHFWVPVLAPSDNPHWWDITWHISTLLGPMPPPANH